MSTQDTLHYRNLADCRYRVAAGRQPAPWHGRIFTIERRGDGSPHVQSFEYQ